MCTEGKWIDDSAEFGMVQRRETIVHHAISSTLSSSVAARLTAPFQQMSGLAECATNWRPTSAHYVYVKQNPAAKKAYDPPFGVNNHSETEHASSSSSSTGNKEEVPTASSSSTKEATTSSAVLSPLYWRVFADAKCEVFSRTVLELLWYLHTTHSTVQFRGSRIVQYGHAIVEMNVALPTIVRTYLWTEAWEATDSDPITNPFLHRVVWLETEDGMTYLVDFASAQYGVGNARGEPGVWNTDDASLVQLQLPYVIADLPSTMMRSSVYGMIDEMVVYDEQERLAELLSSKRQRRVMYNMIRFLTRHILLLANRTFQWTAMSAPPYEQLYDFHTVANRHRFYDERGLARPCCEKAGKDCQD